MDLMHAPTGSTLYVAVYWVPHAASIAFLIAGLLFAPYYLVPIIRRWLSRQHAPPSPRRHK